MVAISATGERRLHVLLSFGSGFRKRLAANSDTRAWVSAGSVLYEMAEGELRPVSIPIGGDSISSLEAFGEVGLRVGTGQGRVLEWNGAVWSSAQLAPDAYIDRTSGDGMRVYASVSPLGVFMRSIE